MPEPDQSPEPIQTVNPPANGPPLRTVLFVVIFLLVAFIAGAGYYIWKQATLADLQKIAQRARPTSTPTPSLPSTSSVFSFTGCEIQKQQNPLVEDVRVLVDTEDGDVVVGALRGNINKISLAQNQRSATIELISPKAEQTYTFTAEEESGLVYDGIDLKDLSLSDLRQGMTVVTSFNCFPSQDNKFLITRIAVTGK